MDDGGPELSQRERAVLISLEQSLARGELVPERTAGPARRRLRLRLPRPSAVPWWTAVAALVVVAGCIGGLVRLEMGMRDLLVGVLLLLLVNAVVVLALLLTPAYRSLSLGWQLRRLRGRSRRARRRDGRIDTRSGIGLGPWR